MSKQKASPEKAQRRGLRLREFPEWPVEQVMEVARMLYATAPFKRELWNNKSHWTLLARQACDFLDHLHKACKEISEQRSATHRAYRHAEELNQELETLPEIVPFNNAAKIITKERVKARSLTKLKK